MVRVNGVCECCGDWMGDAPHSIALHVDLRSTVRVRVCVRCRDWIAGELTEALTLARHELARLAAERAAG